MTARLSYAAGKAERIAALSVHLHLPAEADAHAVPGDFLPAAAALRHSLKASRMISFARAASAALAELTSERGYGIPRVLYFSTPIV